MDKISNNTLNDSKQKSNNQNNDIFQHIHKGYSKTIGERYSFLLFYRKLFLQKPQTEAITNELEKIQNGLEEIIEVINSNIVLRPKNKTAIVEFIHIKGDLKFCPYNTVEMDYIILKNESGIRVFHERQKDPDYRSFQSNKYRFRIISKMTDFDKCYILHLYFTLPDYCKIHRVVLDKRICK